MFNVGYLRIFKALRYRIPFPGRHFCVFCKHKTSGFMPYLSGSEQVPRLMLALDVIGSNVDLFGCPWCRSTDRERHLYLYMQSVNLFSYISGKSILHFAAEVQLSKKIALASPVSYIKCDLFPKNEDVICVDIQKINFMDDSFDLIIANHVLEHVADERMALSEIFRVLRPGGYAILQTPYSNVLSNTWSDPGISSDVARLESYGQEDHVRLFGSDIFNKFKESGLSSCVKLHDELLSEFPGFYYGINSREPFFLFKK